MTLKNMQRRQLCELAGSATNSYVLPLEHQLTSVEILAMRVMMRQRIFP